MFCSRLIATLTAVMFLVVCAGCSSDEGKKDSNLTGAGATTQARASDNAVRQTKAASFTGSRAESTDKDSIDISLVTPDAVAAIVIRPRRIAQLPLVAEQLKDEMMASAIKKVGFDPNEVEQIVVLFSVGEIYPGHPQLLPSVVAHFTRDVKAKEIATKLQAMDGSPGPHRFNEVKVGGKTCLDAGGSAMLYAPNKTTIILTPKANIAAVVCGAEPKGPLVGRLKEADTDNDIFIALNLDAYPMQNIEMAKKLASPLVANYLDAAKTLRGGTASFNLTAAMLLRVVLDTKDTETAGNVEDLLQQALRMAREGLAQAKQGILKEDQATFGPLLKLAEECVDSANIAQSGSQVTFDVKRPKIIDSDGASISSAVTQSVLEAIRQSKSMNNIRRISIAIAGYALHHSRHYPPAVIEKDGKPLLSWRVAILPYMGEEALYKQFNLVEAWDSPRNLALAKTMPFVFQPPGSSSDGKTRVMLFTGNGAAFDGGKSIGAADIRDGWSNTILCVEAGSDKAVPWTKPEDLHFDPENPLATLGKVSPHGFIAAFFDVHVEQLKVDDKTLKALITPDGGELIDWPKLHASQ